ncbi:MAG TPA: DNA gyrase C-terminal beta-propeller domain-containing protein, partial [Longimicrobium sp.]
YGNPRKVGLNAINVLEGDELISVQISDSSCEVILATYEGMAIRFPQGRIREMGRATTGVRGIALQGDDRVVGMVVTKPGPTLLVVTETGMGKRTDVEAYRLQGRGGKGVINIRATDKTGRVVAIMEVHPGDELMVITRQGVINRQPVNGIRVIGRNTQGVKLINLGPKDTVMDVARVVNEDAVPEPIVSEAEETTEIVPSAALEDEIGLDEDMEDDDSADVEDVDDEELPEEDYTDDHLDSLGDLDDDDEG